MRRIIAWCVGSLPFEPRSRRAIDETLADWAYEQHESPTRRRRTLAGVQGLLSIARVVSIACVRETADLSWGRGLAPRCGLVAGLVTLIAFATASPMLDALGAETFALVLLGMPLALVAGGCAGHLRGPHPAVHVCARNVFHRLPLGGGRA